METRSKLNKNISLLCILFLSGALIYTLPYFHFYYYDAFKSTFKMTNTEVGLCGSYYGLLGMVSYLIGGIIADRISIKILIPGSLIVTGALGLYLLTIPSPITVAIIHGIWGITSLMTFWPALIKALRLVGNSDEQSKVFGIFEGGRGVTNAVILAIAAALFMHFTASGNNTQSVLSIIILYSVSTIILGVLNIFLLRRIKETSNGTSTSGSFNFKMIGTVLKKPGIWLMSGIVFCTYMINISYYYIAPYASAAFGVSVLAAAIISSSSQYIRPVSALSSGFLGDRIGSSKVMLIGQIVSLVGLIIVLITPIHSTVVFVMIGCVLIYAAMYTTQSMHFAIMEEIDIPAEISGTAIGIVCTLGYLPEVLSPMFSGRILDHYGKGLEGYRLIFILLIVFTITATLLTAIWIRQTKVKRSEILSLHKKVVEQI